LKQLKTLKIKPYIRDINTTDTYLLQLKVAHREKGYDNTIFKHKKFVVEKLKNCRRNDVAWHTTTIYDEVAAFTPGSKRKWGAPADMGTLYDIYKIDPEELDVVILACKLEKVTK